MVAAALADGTADRDCVFEVFARRLPHGRRYGVLAGTGRLLEALPHFRFGDAELAALRDAGASTTSGCWTGWPTSGSPATSTATPRATSTSPARRCSPCARPSPRRCCWRRWRCRCSTTTAPSPRPRARMVGAACERPCIEMGSRRTHEEAAVAAARAALPGRLRRHLEPRGRTPLRRAHHRHQRARLHAAARRRGGRVPGAGGHPRRRDDAAGRHLRRRAGHPDGGRGRRPGARRRSGSTPATCRRWPPAPGSCSTQLGATKTRIIVTSDLDEYAIAGLAAAPVDGYGVGTSLVTGSGAPTVGMVYKLVERDGVPVAKNSEGKRSVGGRKHAVRRHDADGTATAEVVSAAPIAAGERDRDADRAAGARRRAGRPTQPRRGAGGGHGSCTSGCGRRCRRRRWSLIRGEPVLETLDRSDGRQDERMTPRAGRRRRPERLLRGRQPRRRRRRGGRRAIRPTCRPPGTRTSSPPATTTSTPGTTSPSSPTSSRPGRRTASSAPAASSCTRARPPAASRRSSTRASTPRPTPASRAAPTGSGLADWLRAHDVDAVDVVGIATDHCVRATALDAVGAGFATRVLLHLTAGVAEATTKAALDQLAHRGRRTLGGLDHWGLTTTGGRRPPRGVSSAAQRKPGRHLAAV